MAEPRLPQPCPFCGSEEVDTLPASVESYVHGSLEHHWLVMCQNSACLAAGPVRATLADAWAAWSERVAQRPVQDLNVKGSPYV